MTLQVEVAPACPSGGRGLVDVSCAIEPELLPLSRLLVDIGFTVGVVEFSVYDRVPGIC